LLNKSKNGYGYDFQKIKSLMLKNYWINPMHTNIPAPDGSLAYGGACFPKYMKKLDSENMVLQSNVNECENVRK
jgi:hypothetical protein